MAKFNVKSLINEYVNCHKVTETGEGKEETNINWNIWNKERQQDM